MPNGFWVGGGNCSRTSTLTFRFLNKKESSHEIHCVCIVVDCGDLSDSIQNGAVTIQGTSYGQQATYSCNNNFGVDGAEVLTCEASGQWSSEPPTCSSKHGKTFLTNALYFWRKLFRLFLRHTILVTSECQNL